MRILIKGKLNLIERMITHGFIGGLLGFFLLHPASMYIYYNFDQSQFLNENILWSSFSIHHLAMALFFAALGMVFGMIHGIYHHRITTYCDEIKALSITDDLTVLYNRRHFFNRFQEEITRAQRYSRKLFLVMLDIDDFKKYNDTYGHLKGDDVLRIFADFLKKSVRTPDFVARYGGDEFVILMPEADEDKAVKMTQRLCSEVVNCTLPDNRTFMQHGLSISLGFAGFPADAKDIDTLLHKADRALYSAKREGKNKVCGTVLSGS